MVVHDIKLTASFKRTEFEFKKLSRGSNIVGKNCIKFFKIEAGAQLKPVFGGFETRLKLFKFGHSLNKIFICNYVFD